MSFIPPTNVILEEDENAVRFRIPLWVAPLSHVIKVGPEPYIIHFLKGYDSEVSPELVALDELALYALFVKKLAERTTYPTKQQLEDAMHEARRMAEPGSWFHPNRPSLVKILEALYGEYADEAFEEVRKIEQAIKTIRAPLRDKSQEGST